MEQTSKDFKVASIGAKFKQACLDLDKLLASLGTADADTLRQSLRAGVKEYKQQGTLSIAFIGQYSAGKSTIISALTGRRDIHIDADIATDKTTAYAWNGVKLIDTPGLFTDREDHDEITYKAIEKADLLVFCLTYMLFDSITVANFKKLAYDKRYGWKMMLVVNKMSDEAGEEEQKVESYRKSLSEALHPQSLNDFSICFIDAKDYCEGVDGNEEFLQEISRFATFTTALNDFVACKASYSKLDTPIRIVLRVVDDTETIITPDNSQDAVYLEILRRLYLRVEQERERLRTKVKGIQLEMASAILAEGDNLVQFIGDESFRELNEQSEIKVREYYERAEKNLQRVLEKAIESIRLEIESELKKDLPQAFVARLKAQYKAGDHDIRDEGTVEQLKKSVGWLSDIAEKSGSPMYEQFFRQIPNLNYGRGSQTHTFVKAAGKTFGYKFKPWEAVKISKKIGNTAKFLGPAVALIGVASEGYAIYEESKREQNILNIRRNIQQQFQCVSNDLKLQIDGQLQEFEQQIYDDIQSTVSQARRENELITANTNKAYQKLMQVRESLMFALEDLKTIVPVSKN